jgi:amidase
MARSVEDLKLGLDILAGPNHWDKPAWRLQLPPLRRQVLKQYRVAAWLDDPACRLEPEVGDLLEKAAQALAATGATVDYKARPEFTLEKVAETFLALLQAAQAGGVPPDRMDEYAATVGNTAHRLHAPTHSDEA